MFRLHKLGILSGFPVAHPVRIAKSFTHPVTDREALFYTEGVRKLQPRATPWVNSPAKRTATLKGLLTFWKRWIIRRNVRRVTELTGTNPYRVQASQKMFPQGVTLGCNSPTPSVYALYCR